MKRKEFNKLVRDRIPEIIQSNRAMPVTRRLNGSEYIVALKAKLHEEVQELINAKTKSDVQEELSDILEVIEAIAEHNKIPLSNIKEEQQKKRENRGGFSQRIFLEYTEED